MVRGSRLLATGGQLSASESGVVREDLACHVCVQCADRRLRGYSRGDEGEAQGLGAARGERGAKVGRLMARDPLADPERSIRAVYAYVAYRVGPGPDAEDITSDVFERALRYRASYDPKRGRADGLADRYRTPVRERSGSPIRTVRSIPSRSAPRPATSPRMLSVVSRWPTPCRSSASATGI